MTQSNAARVIVVGGGPGGLAAAGVLARGGMDVTLLEAGAYPRTRLCGEFLSPDAEASLAALGAPGLADRLGAPHLRAVRVTVASRGRQQAALAAALPRPGRGVSRVDLDAQLATAVRAAGADVRERTRVRAVHTDAAGVVVEARAATLSADALVVATGRLARPAGARDDVPRTRRWVGVKLHVRGPRLPGVTELHFVQGAYVGLNEVSRGGERCVNVCALATQDYWDDAGGAVPALLAALAAASPAFGEHWRRAGPALGDGAVAAGFSFARRGATCAPGVSSAPGVPGVPGVRPALVCGDAAAAITPLCGDGQAMALAMGAAAARELLARRGAGGGLGAEAVRAAARAFSRRASRETGLRLVAGRALQAALLHPAAAIPLVRLAAAARCLPAWLYRVTRGPLTDRSGA